MLAQVIPGSDVMTEFIKVSPIGAAVIIICWMFLKALDKREDKCAENTNRIVDSFREEMTEARNFQSAQLASHEKHWEQVRQGLHDVRNFLPTVCAKNKELGS
jgi:hypothetical protein